MLRSDPQEIEVTVVFDDDDTESTKPNFPLIFFFFHYSIHFNILVT